MNRDSRYRYAAFQSFIGVFVSWGWAAFAQGQTDSTQAPTRPWAAYQDPVSGSLCEVVHAENAELVILEESNQLVLVSGPDVILRDTVIDAEGNVTFEGTPAGVIDFQQDGDGNQSLWWTGLTGEVVSVDGFTGEPSPTTSRPIEFRNVSCDGCDYWDDPQVCAEPEEPEPMDPVTVNICGQAVMFPLTLSFMGLICIRPFRGARFRPCLGDCDSRRPKGWFARANPSS